MTVLEAEQFAYESLGPEETFKVGQILGLLLQPGDVVCLVGGLGSGKTVMTQGIALGLGVEEGVRSPTFALVHEYPGRCPIYHIDLYRLDRPEGILELGWEEYLYGRGVSIIEWAEKAEGLLPEERLTVQIEPIHALSRSPDLERSEGGEERRALSFFAYGPRYQDLLQQFLSVFRVPGSHRLPEPCPLNPFLQAVEGKRR